MVDDDEVLVVCEVQVTQMRLKNVELDENECGCDDERGLQFSQVCMYLLDEGVGHNVLYPPYHLVALEVMAVLVLLNVVEMQ